MPICQYIFSTFCTLLLFFLHFGLYRINPHIITSPFPKYLLLKKILMNLYKIFLSSIITMLWGTMASASPDLPETLRPLAESNARLGMPNLLEKLKAGEPVKIAYLGGSITAQNGWRVLSRKFIQRKFPNAKVEEINAAIGGTGSDLGCLRVGADVLSKKPDAVFVEFAVNDAHQRPNTIFRNMEGIVRQIWGKSKNIDICFIYTITENNAQELKDGKMSRSASAMEALADYYSIPSIHFGKAVADAFAANKITMKSDSPVKYVDGESLDETSKVLLTPDGKIPFSKDGVHPYPNTGHLLYAGSFARSFEEFSKMPKDSDALDAARSKPAADNLSPTNIKTIPFAAAELFGDTEDLSWDSPIMSKSFSERAPFKFKKFKKNSGFKFDFHGRKLVMYVLYGPGGGEATVSTDSQAPRKIRFFDGYCSYYRMMPILIFEGNDGRHIVEFKMSDSKIDKGSILLPSHKQDFDKNPKKYEPANGYACCLYVVQ